MDLCILFVVVWVCGFICGVDVWVWVWWCVVVGGDAFVTLPWFVLAWEFSLIVSISEKVCRCGSGFVCMCCYVSLWEWICGCVV